MNHGQPQSASTTDDEELMKTLGIVRIPAHVYHYRQYRYSRFEDAVAQARRDLALEKLQ